MAGCGGSNCFNARQRLQYTSQCTNCKVVVPTTSKRTYWCAVCFQDLDPNVAGQWHCYCEPCLEHVQKALDRGAGPSALGKANASDNRPASDHAAASGNSAASDKPPPPRLGTMVVAGGRATASGSAAASGSAGALAHQLEEAFARIEVLESEVEQLKQAQSSWGDWHGQATWTHNGAW